MNAVENEFVTLLIVNPDGFLAKVDQFLPSPNGDFFRSYQANGPLWKIEGSYTLTLAYQGIKTETSFVVVKSQTTSSDSSKQSSSQTEPPKTAEPPKTEDATLKFPSWIKNNAAWWASGQINDSEFLIGIEYMINENIIVIPNLPQSTTSSEGIVTGGRERFQPKHLKIERFLLAFMVTSHLSWFIKEMEFYETVISHM